jgi:hypothetical protein
MISIVYLVELEDPKAPLKAQDDAASADWYDLSEIIAKPEMFAFDHFAIVLELIYKKPDFNEIKKAYKEMKTKKAWNCIDCTNYNRAGSMKCIVC